MTAPTRRNNQDCHNGSLTNTLIFVVLWEYLYLEKENKREKLYLNVKILK
jgi:hypothetical protein